MLSLSPADLLVENSFQDTVRVSNSLDPDQILFQSVQQLILVDKE